jgi:hypothetical protein
MVIKVIVSDVTENRSCKLNACYTLLMYGMAASFHKYMRTAGIFHLTQQAVNTNRIRSGMS